jgi:serine protease AprX
LIQFNKYNLKNISLLLLMLMCKFSFAQSRYIIKLKNKATNPFSLSNPSAYLGPKAIQRRLRYNIPIDSMDLPITPRYIDSIQNAGAVTILNSSKWLNQITIRTTDPLAIARINNFTFVENAVAVASRANNNNGNVVNKHLDEAGEPIVAGAGHVEEITSSTFSYGQASGQINLHQGSFLHNHGFSGQNMQIAVMDAGFYHYLTLPTFDSIRTNNQITNIWDFVANNNSVDEDHPHGMACLSTMAANIPGVFVGTAPKANYCLYRTEDVSSETRIEEHNLAAGYERADSIGVDVCSISLGYNTFDNATQNYTYANMDGNTTMSARASDIAAKKGMLPVVAAGNDGAGSWHYITTPADADSVMTVGAVDTLGNVASFSGYGPSSNGRIKPNVAATGLRTVIANNSSGLPSNGNGTSFATPTIAGLTTCLWQAFPEVNNMAILNAMQQAGTRSTNPNDRVGYGIPDMKKAFAILLKKMYTQNVSQSNCAASFSLNVKLDNTMNIIVEKKPQGSAIYSTIKTILGTGNFANKNILFADDLTTTTIGNAMYRVRIDIATDTSFYLDSMIVNVTKPNLGADKIVAKCDNNVINLNLLYNTTSLLFSWTNNGNAVTNPTQVIAPGTYQIIDTNTLGCADTALVMLTANPTLNIGTDKNIFKCTDSSINLTTLYTTTNLNTSWQLSGTVITNTTAVNLEGEYKLVASNFYGCADTAFVNIKNDISLCPVPKINVITDGNNYHLENSLKIYIFNGFAARVDVVIFNAIGQKVYTYSGQQTVAPKTYTIPTNNFMQGIYFVSILINGKMELSKQVVKGTSY